MGSNNVDAKRYLCGSQPKEGSKTSKSGKTINCTNPKKQIKTPDNKMVFITISVLMTLFFKLKNINVANKRYMKNLIKYDNETKNSSEPSR